MNWQQLRAIIWLRWRLSRNQFSRGGPVNAVLSIIALVFVLLLAAGLAVGASVGGWFLGSAQSVPPWGLLLVWDGAIFLFLVFWFSGLMVEIQRSESVDLEKLLRLPVTLQQVFVFNYAASHFTPSIIILVPPMLGLCVGLAFGGGAGLLLQAPVFLSFIFAITSWTYCLRGWLAALMVNKRRRRAVIVWVTIAFVLVAQTPNLIFNSRYFRNWAHPSRKDGQKGASSRKNNSEPYLLPEAVVEGHIVLPLGWPGYSAMTLKEHKLFPALATAAASCLLGVLGLMRAYRMTLRFYTGADTASAPGMTSTPAAKAVATPTGRDRPLLVERRLPWLRDDTTAMALATLRSLMRAPEVKMALIMPVVMGAVMLSLYFKKPKGPIPLNFAGFVSAAAVAAAALSLVPTMSNVFGLDRNGFRALVLLPTERRQFLFAKNLAFFPIVAGVCLVLLLMVKLVMGLPWAAFVTGLFQAPAAFFLFSLLTNYVSILAPYRLAQGTLQAKKPKAIIFVAVFASFIALPFVLLPIMIPPAMELLARGLDWPAWAQAGLVSSILVLLGAMWLYRGMLPVQGRLLQRREQIILREVTEETE